MIYCVAEFAIMSVFIFRKETVMSKRPVCLIIRDGWGMNPRFDGNSVFSAKTPVIDALRTRYPWCRIECSGEEVASCLEIIAIYLTNAVSLLHCITATIYSA